MFYSGLNDYKYEDLINFYNNQADSYHPNILIITDEGVSFSIRNLNLTNLNLKR